MSTLVMDEFSSVLCVCPSSRLSLASLVLSTWSGVRRYVLTDEEPTEADLAGMDAVIVMDRFVTEPLVKRIADRKPAIVLAWNGLFEIQRYKQLLGDLDVIYMGPDESLSSVRYVPMINADCTFARWCELYQQKQQFSARGSFAFRLRWTRTRLMGARALSLAIAAVGALQRPRAFRRTLESGVVSDKLVWAGHCYFDASIGLTESEETLIAARLDEIRAKPTAAERLDASLKLVAEWRARPTTDNAHQVFYVTNTLLRWSVLSFLSDTAKQSTWFFGRDNLGLGLELELYVHNLVPNERVAFLELGGTKTGDTLYPRALHLLARQFYVIAISPDGSGDVATVVDGISRALAERPREFFSEIERRRRQLYTSLPSRSTLREVHQRVWRDFDSFAG